MRHIGIAIIILSLGIPLCAQPSPRDLGNGWTLRTTIWVDRPSSKLHQAVLTQAERRWELVYLRDHPSYATLQMAENDLAREATDLDKLWTECEDLTCH